MPAERSTDKAKPGDKPGDSPTPAEQRKADAEKSAAATADAAATTTAAKLAEENAKAVKARKKQPPPPTAKADGKYRVAADRTIYTRRGPRHGAGVLGRTEGDAIDPARDFPDSPMEILQGQLNKGTIEEAS